MTELPRLERYAKRLDFGFLRPGRDLVTGRHRTAFRGQGSTFLESREYQYGDDIRHLDWNVTARAGRPFVKLHEQERGISVIVVLDLSASLRTGDPAAGKADLAREIAVLIALWARRGPERLGVVLCTDHVEESLAPQRSTAHSQHALAAIRGWHPSGSATALAPALQQAARLLERPGMVVVISDFFAADYEAALADLARTHNILGVAIEDPADRTLPDAGVLRVRDPETGATRWIDTTAARVRDAFASRWQAIAARRAAAFDRAHSPLVTLTVGQPYLPTLLRLSHRRPTS